MIELLTTDTTCKGKAEVLLALVEEVNRDWRQQSTISDIPEDKQDTILDYFYEARTALQILKDPL